MLVYGIVIQTRPHQVKIKIPIMDNFETDWIFVPQLCTVGDKSSNSIKINTLVAAVMDDELQDGCIIGAVYNDEDLCIIEDENVKLINFEDGTLLKYDKSEHKLSIEVAGDVKLICKNADITADLTTITGKTIFNDEVEILKTLNTTGTITSASQICDLTGTMTSIRSLYNSHTHGNGNAGAATTTPQQQF